ncbi:hypothetical protein CF68_23440 [Cupriavidus sp. SK-4]|nr:hypothetical protein CF68_23440 [Cupriavidus sp. SK-4]
MRKNPCFDVGNLLITIRKFDDKCLLFFGEHLFRSLGIEWVPRSYWCLIDGDIYVALAIVVFIEKTMVNERKMFYEAFGQSIDCLFFLHSPGFIIFAQDAIALLPDYKRTVLAA